jgi:virulence factor Mce-like protein
VTRNRTDLIRATLTNPLLIGALVILWTGIAVFISSTAQNGLPFVPTYEVVAELPDADNLAVGDDVRVGGARIGQVRTITADKPAGVAPYARVTLALSTSAKVPVDSTVEVLPASILGAQYLALTPGRSHARVPDGGTLPLSQARSAVQLSDVLDVFGQPTASNIQNSVIALGNALAGRGAALNDTIAAAAQLLPPLDRVLTVLDEHRADLAGFIRGAAATTGALAPVAGTLVSLIRNGSQTLQAIDAAGGSLGQALDELPATESVSTRALDELRPVLSDAAMLTRGLQPAAPKLATVTGELAAAFETATTVLRRAPGPLAGLSSTLSRLGVAAGPFREALKVLTPAVTSLTSILDLFEPAQVYCNVGGLFVRNVDSAFSDGDSTGSWYRIVLIGLPAGQYLQEPAPAANLHMDYYPVENQHECQAGNEPYKPGQDIGDPGPTSNTTQLTYPPPGVTQLAQKAGVLP